MPLTITHFTTDSLPRVVTGAAGTSTLDVLLPFRVDLDDPALTVTGWSLDVDVDGRSWGSRVRTRRLRPGLAERAARADGPYGGLHLRPPALLRRAARRRRPRRPCGLPGVPCAGRGARGGGDVHAVRDGVPRRRAAPGRSPPPPGPCTPSTRASPATTCGASTLRARSTPARPGCCTTAARAAWTSSGSTSPTWAGHPSAPSWSCRWAGRSSTSPPAGTRRCRWSTSRRTR